ncbi:MAG: hypothetical protein IJ388_02075 [Oscillospiraceae bacterium]|nr:hypothetical protein [Oscillospiraceae bacterium]
MKKVISLVLVLLLMFSICSCGEKKIALTADNCTDYLKIKTQASHASDVSLKNGPNGYSAYKATDGTTFFASSASSYYTISVFVEGVSSNYQYEDITLEINLSGYYYSCSRGDIDKYDKLNKTGVNQKLTVKCNLNVSGTGKGEVIFKIPNNEVVPCGFGGMSEKLNFEICGITGSVKAI